MSSDRDVTRIVRSWIREDGHESADRVLDSVLDQLDTTPQRRAGWPAWRTPTMNKFVTIGLGVAAVVAILLVGAQLLGSPSGGLGADPTATATPEPTPQATPSPSADAFLPQGPILIWDPSLEGSAPGASTITVTISANGWQFHDDYQWLQKGTDEVDDAVVWPGSWTPGTGIYVYGDPCRWQSTMPETPARTVDEIVNALAAQPTLDASQPVDVAIGGYAGKAVTLQRPADANDDDCDGGESGVFQTEDRTGPDFVYGAPGQTNEFWFGDVEGSIVMLFGRYLPDTPDASVEEMRAIVDSATFEVP
jgi:hypothetical protein